MSFTSLGLLAAFVAGVLSFLAPCVLPLVPGYLSYLAGTTLEEGQIHSTIHSRVIVHAVWFVLGFAALYTVLGAAAELFGSVLVAHQQLLERIGGLLLILLGVALTGLVPLPWLSGDHRILVGPGRSVWWRSGLIGIAFGASWSACTTPVLGAMLMLTAGGRGHILQGSTLMLAFALGLGIPFVIVAVLVDRARPFLLRVRRYTALFSSIGSAILIVIGIFLLTGLFRTSG